MTQETSTFTAFSGHDRIAKGTLQGVVQAAKEGVDAAMAGDVRLAIYDDRTGRVVDIDFRGSLDDVLRRLATHPIVGTATEQPRRKGPGRPKLGVLSKEVSLLPRHWEWLARQQGSASATLRRLIDEARKENPARDRATQAQEAAHAFMWDMAGDLPGFEEASRAFYRKDFVAFYDRIAAWPNDVRDHAQHLVERYRAHDETARKQEQ